MLLCHLCNTCVQISVAESCFSLPSPSLYLVLVKFCCYERHRNVSIYYLHEQNDYLVVATLEANGENIKSISKFQCKRAQNTQNRKANWDWGDSSADKDTDHTSLMDRLTSLASMLNFGYDGANPQSQSQHSSGELGGTDRR